MATDDVISSLVRDLKPVAPLPRPRVRVSRWAAVTLPVSLGAVAILGLRPDFLTVVPTIPFQAHLLLLLLTAAASANAALALAIPGEPAGLWRRSAAPVALAAWGAWLAGELLVFAASGEEVWPVAAGWGCIAKAFAVGVTPGLVLAIMVGRGAPVDARRTMVFAAMGAAAIGASGVELTCPLTSPTHLLLWHAGPALAVVLVVASLGRESFIVRAVFGRRR